MQEGSSLSFVSHLNDAQKKAVETTQGHLLVLAGAGTGKTLVLTSRIAYILLHKLADPHEILAVTFTNKAALEMKERLARFSLFHIQKLWLGTFHSMSARILRNHATLVGLSSSFSIIDKDDQLRLIKQLLKDVGSVDLNPRYVTHMFDRWKNQGLNPDKIHPTDRAETLLHKIYSTYQDRLRSLDAVDFGDLLLHNLTIFEHHPNILNLYQNQFRYVLVDEYQDTNVAQYLWLRLLAFGHNNLCCVGDDDQSIYGWRGAEIHNILKFEKDFPNAQTICLEQNYRSSGHILGAASGLIAHNKGRLHKTLWTEFGDGEKLTIVGLRSCEDEARYVCERVTELHATQGSFNAFAVLVRAGFQTRILEETFLLQNLPYRIIGGVRFYERQEIRDALAYARLLAHSKDGLAFERVINIPKRGIGRTALQNIHGISQDKNISLVDAAYFYTEHLAKAAQKKTLLTFFETLEACRNALFSTSHDEVLHRLLEESGYYSHWRQESSPDAAGRLENLKELIKAVRESESLIDFLEHVSLVTDKASSTEEQYITLMTLHSAKGLEFPVVFLPGWEEGLFPHLRSLQEKGDEGLEEERRLAYVGISRAQKHVVITYAEHRKHPAGWQPSYASRFVREIPEEHVTRMTRQPSYGTKPLGFQGSFGSSKTIFRIGERVLHEKFGYGVIQACEEDCFGVEFKEAGYKNIVPGFLSKCW